MSRKYGPLTDYLSEVSRDTVVLSFSEIESIIDAQLPPSAHDYREWWANQAHGSQAGGWVDAGWRVAEVNLSQQRTTFERLGHAPPRIPHDAGAARSERTSIACSRAWTRSELERELTAFERELRAAGLAEDAILTFVDRSGVFLRWLGGDYTPHGPRPDPDATPS